MAKWLAIALTASFQILMCAFGATTTINGITWYYTVSNNKVILGFTEQDDTRHPAIPQTTSGALTIPSSIGSKTVVEIGPRAFEDCEELTSVTIPSTITNICGWAFIGCTKLASVTLGSGVRVIDGGAFGYCKSLTNITIPSSVTFIAPDAFYLEGWADETPSSEQTPFGVKLEMAKVNVARKVLTGELSLETPNPRYDLATSQADRTIATVTINADTALSNFTLSNGKVYDTVIRIVNTSANQVRVTLPSGYTYETLKGAKPLTIPPNSKNLLTITRVAADTFFVSRRELETVQ